MSWRPIGELLVCRMVERIATCACSYIPSATITTMPMININTFVEVTLKKLHPTFFRACTYTHTPSPLSTTIRRCLCTETETS